MNAHVCSVREEAGKFFWTCMCGDRATALLDTRWEAQEQAGQHEHEARIGKFSVPAPRPTLKTLAAHMRERSQMDTYSPGERAQWIKLAEEIEDRLKHKNDQIEGQETLFD